MHFILYSNIWKLSSKNTTFLSINTRFRVSAIWWRTLSELPSFRVGLYLCTVMYFVLYNTYTKVPRVGKCYSGCYLRKKKCYLGRPLNMGPHWIRKNWGAKHSVSGGKKSFTLTVGIMGFSAIRFVWPKVCVFPKVNKRNKRRGIYESLH